jgi:Fe-S-cluster containining protein
MLSIIPGQSSIENSGLVTLHQGNSFDPNEAHHRKHLDFQIDLSGRVLNLTISYADRPLKLSDLVPMARALCTKVVNAAAEIATDWGARITCSKGCTYCCSYLAPLSPAEAFRIRDEILTMPVNRRRHYLRSMMVRARYILNHSQPLQQPEEPSSLTSQQNSLQNISEWYGSLKLACPFLSNRQCGIYQLRPLACREHLVSSPASVCNFTSPAMPQIISLPVSVAEILMMTSCRLEGTQQEAVMLPFTMVWAEENRARSQQTWQGKVLVETFVESLNTMLLLREHQPQTTAV